MLPGRLVRCSVNFHYCGLFSVVSGILLGVFNNLYILKPYYNLYAVLVSGSSIE